MKILCNLCGKSFKTASGLGAHRFWRHNSDLVKVKEAARARAHELVDEVEVIERVRGFV